MKVAPPHELPQSVYMTPGGFHSFEHRWALDEAFRASLGCAHRQMLDVLSVVPPLTSLGILVY